jgi:hypothetical protein
MVPKAQSMKNLLIAGLLAAFALTACGRSSNVSTQSAVTGAPQTSGGTIIVRAGTKAEGRLQQEISTNKSHDGDAFTIDVQNSMFHHNPPALVGAVIEGHLANVTPAGMGKKPGLTLVFDDIKMPDGATAPADVTIVNMGLFNAKTHRWRTAGMMLGGAIAGHMVAGKHHGGVAGAAGGYLLSQHMKSNVDVKRGTLIEVRFSSDATSAQQSHS